MRIPAVLISLATPDLPRLQHFYQSLLGIPAQAQIPTDGEPVYVEFRLLGLRLGLYRASHGAERHHSHHPDFVARPSAMSLCLQVEDLQGSLSEIQAVLEDYRIAASPVRQDFHGQEVDFPDPDGNHIVLHQPSPAFWQAMNLDPQG
ncbi:VOC family protein [Synechococcus sp. Nb3U1]|uniref:VOC family protein n=1 Tax=Synechococcus sp. Nb3U1 TaxID=1914529 RepID=UPI001F3D7515|nr:VOC family protein [Synechococcus sp. Nb3U1]MCF2971177.1 VOC family protein [Synechococcus sp. Nb3U1]